MPCFNILTDKTHRYHFIDMNTIAKTNKLILYISFTEGKYKKGKREVATLLH